MYRNTKLNHPEVTKVESSKEDIKTLIKIDVKFTKIDVVVGGHLVRL